MNTSKLVEWGEAAPWFVAPAPINPRFDFSSLGGRFVVLVFFGNADLPGVRDRLKEMSTKVKRWPDDRCVMFGVSNSKADWEDNSVLEAFRPARIFHDENWDIARSYGVLTRDAENGQLRFKPRWYVLDPTLRVYSHGDFTQFDRFYAEMDRLPAPSQHASATSDPWAPVLMVPRVLSPSFCRALIDYYKAGDAQESGFMRAEGNKTVGMTDPSFKRRMDVNIVDERLKVGLRSSLVTRLVPELKKAFQYEATRIERYIVACYDSQSQGFFKPHRDNTTSGTAHRRFAVTINLNAEDFEGGELRFPEFGMRTYKAPTGGAVVFSCSLLHEAMPVTAGTRYATLPFLYGDADAEVRLQNRANVVGVQR
ncbi:2OG-Fe(II) oxygenase [Kordiimonas gwangyangensis]|uniref:2OG-Fe(II) oxygenase n=1 Tax=Kordiimonas gwangyangensis TaxID=288022 RepID=UPI00036D78F1|nr:2OG-Fe(II) oxygenase [Kordiimonas gwangyangensis]